MSGFCELDSGSDCLVLFGFIVKVLLSSITRFSPVFDSLVIFFSIIEVLLSVFDSLYDSSCIDSMSVDSSSVDSSSELK